MTKLMPPILANDLAFINLIDTPQLAIPVLV